ncbi:MAG: response regulator [Leptolyngbya sp. SIO1D8]|nr:response regulator [Leptolyngbya sp. SIO1D8]
MAISQRIVRQMGGYIQVQSQLNKGSEFFFTIDLPLVKEKGKLGHLNRSVGGAFVEDNHIVGYRGDRQTILVVDDRWENRTVFLNLLELLDFRIIEAENGQVGLEKLRDEQPDLVITDIVMPVMDGFELLRSIRSAEDLKHYPVIVSSASVASSDQQMAFAHGADHFLAKPVDTQVLLNLLSDCLNLEWVYASQADVVNSSESVPVEVVLPSRETLETLLALAHRDNIKVLREQLGQLVQHDEQYLPFVESMLQLTQQFQTEEIEVRLQQYLEIEMC